jgi:Holliday junction resolvasome RuvABC endonuclease subunit
MRILALDTASITGWACNDPRESGIQKFELRRGSSAGFRFLEFRTWVTDLVMKTNPDLIVYELAHYRGGAATELCVGFVTRVMEIAASMAIDYHGVHTQTLKKFACGKGNAGKPEMITAAARILGRSPITDDEADAVLLLAFAEAGFPEGRR